MLLPNYRLRKYKPVLYTANIKSYSAASIDSLQPMSFQPLLRTHAMKSIALNMTHLKQSDLNFNMYLLPESCEISTELYYTSRRGTMFFPKDLLGTTADRIKNRKHIYKIYIEDFCKKFKIKEEWLTTELQYRNFLISTTFLTFDDDHMLTMNKEIDDIIIPYFNDLCTYRV